MDKKNIINEYIYILYTIIYTCNYIYRHINIFWSVDQEMDAPKNCQQGQTLCSIWDTLISEIVHVISIFWCKKMLVRRWWDHLFCIKLRWCRSFRHRFPSQSWFLSSFVLRHVVLRHVHFPDHQDAKMQQFRCEIPIELEPCAGQPGIPII